MRPLKGNLSLDREGVLIVDLPTRMSYEDFLEEEKLKTIYAEELRECLLSVLGARVIFIHECVVSS